MVEEVRDALRSCRCERTHRGRKREPEAGCDVGVDTGRNGEEGKVGSVTTWEAWLLKSTAVGVVSEQK